jgi:hypothetical protein
MRWNLASPLLSDETLRSNASCVFPLLAGFFRAENAIAEAG